ncbi:hypothetical protein Ae201684P_006016 [Aphanomyces euteiches]|nr:hypothetical protein Ae201684P_006016 [Aphanomyces euteiches]
MTDYAEEQMMEVEALESIYMDDFTKVQDAPLVVKVHIVPNQDGGKNHVALSLVFKMPETYPDTAPNVDVVLEKGLSDRQEKEIRALLDQQIEENLTMVMVYTICEAVREYLLENNREGNDGSEYQEMLRRQEQRQKKDTLAAEAEQAKIDASEAGSASKSNVGTPVTVETFAAWKKAFDAEMATKEGTKGAANGEKRLTGRQLWTSGAAKEDTSTDADEIGSQRLDGDDDDEDDEDYVDGQDEDDEVDDE